MSAYAALMKQAGHDVSGSDRAESAILEDLRSQGIQVSLVQDGSSISLDTDLLVYSEAIPETSKERMLASQNGIPQKSYFHALGELTKGKQIIAICGTHGKSSTTAMIAKIFIDAGKDPSVVVGTKMKELHQRNWRAGNSNLWIVEACEYRKSFLHIHPTVVVLTNADGDHFDAFSSLEDYQNAFVEFICNLPNDGVVVLHGNDADSIKIAKQAKKTIIDADTLELPETGAAGMHMRNNARLALVVAKEEKIDLQQAKKSLLEFTGTWRRMEVRGETHMGVTVIDDYAHHPIEIKATISAMKERYPKRRLVCVFEPHTNDRVLQLWKEFTQSFAEADLVLVTKVYDARPDKDKELVDVAKFAAEIGKTSKVSCRPTGTILRTKTTLETLLQHGDVLLIMGAGNSTNLATSMVS